MKISKIKALLCCSALALTTVWHSSALAEEKTALPALSTAALTDVFANQPAKGDIKRGAELHQKYWCASCHGPTGEAQSRNYPSIAGQVETYLYKTLLDYREGRRLEGDGRASVMAVSVAHMTDQMLADLAAYYASRPAPKGAKATAPTKAIEDLVRVGDPQRLLTPCASCHAVDGRAGIRPETPALAGLEADYLAHTLRQYRAGYRANDTAKGMRFFAEQLTDAEIEALAVYYAGLSVNEGQE